MSTLKRARPTPTVSQETVAAYGGGGTSRRRPVKRIGGFYRWRGRRTEPSLTTTIRTTQIWQCNSGNTGNYGMAILTEMSNSNTPAGSGVNWFTSCSWGIRFSLQNVICTNGGGLNVTSTNAQYGEFVNLFKYYRIKKVKMVMAPLAATGGTPYPMVYMAFDANDSNSGFASEQEMMNFSGLKEYVFGPPSAPSGGKQFKTVYPKVMESIQVSTGSAFTMPAQKSVWLSTNNPNIQHYGLKVGYYNPSMNSTATAAAFVGSIHVTYEIEFEFKGIA